AFDQRDVYRELAVATDELTRAVKWIHEEERPVPDLGRVPGGDALLCDDGDTGRQPLEALEDDAFGPLVRLGDRGRVRLVADLELARIDIEDLPPGRLGQVAQRFGPRGAILDRHLRLLSATILRGRRAKPHRVTQTSRRSH